jgi:hypothetical protein
LKDSWVPYCRRAICRRDKALDLEERKTEYGGGSGLTNAPVLVWHALKLKKCTIKGNEIEQCAEMNKSCYFV